jgi:hypothetical protein
MALFMLSPLVLFMLLLGGGIIVRWLAQIGRS